MVREIASGVFLHSMQVPAGAGKKGVEYQFFVECAKLQQLLFTVDISGSDNVQLASGGCEKATAIGPYERAEVARVVRISPRKPVALRFDYSWVETEMLSGAAPGRPPSPPQVPRLVAELAELHTGNRQPRVDCAALSACCIAAAVQFTDPEFAPSAQGELPCAGKTAPPPPLVWRRPEHFMPAGTGGLEVFLGRDPSTARARHIRAGGAMAHGRLLSALGLLAERPALLARLFGTGRSSRGDLGPSAAGLFGAWLCCGGQWRAVAVDDWLPCFAGAGHGGGQGGAGGPGGPV